MLTKEATSCGLKCFYMPIYTSIKILSLKFLNHALAGSFSALYFYASSLVYK